MITYLPESYVLLKRKLLVNMEKHTCIGCGIKLQTSEPKTLGFTTRDDALYCQRCYRIKHYGDFTSLKQHSVPSDEVFQAIAKLEGTIMLVIDVTDIDSGLFTGIQRHCMNRDFIIVLTKFDLLPKTVSKQRIVGYLMSKLRDVPIKVLGVATTSHQAKIGAKALVQEIKKLKIKRLITLGYANMGKSTLINAMLEKDDYLTISPYPHTTLKINQIEWANGVIIDTPGIKIEHSFTDLFSFEELEKIQIRKPFKPKTYQLDSAQSFVLPNVGIVSVKPKDKASITLYFSDQYPIHRTKFERLETYCTNNDAQDLYAIKARRFIQEQPIFDIVYKQVGWFYCVGEFEWIEVKAVYFDQVMQRKALI